MTAHYQWVHWEQITVKYKSEYNEFYAKMDFNCRLYCSNDGHNALAFMCWYQFKYVWRIAHSVLIKALVWCLVLSCCVLGVLHLEYEPRGGELLNTAARQLRADCAAANGGCRRVKSVYAGRLCNRRWQCVPLWDSSREKRLPVRLSISTYSAVFISVGSVVLYCTPSSHNSWQ